MHEDNESDQLNSNINYKSITCKDIPELLLDKQVAKKYFSKFGKVRRFILRPKQRQCTVDYETQESAQYAFMNAGELDGNDFLVTYSDGETNQIVPNTEECIPPEIQSELDAMKGSQLFPQRVPRFSSLNKLQEQKTTTKPANVKNELEAIIKRQGVNDEEKYRILDARDKLIRLTTVRPTDIKSAVSTKGTCPDMCPEKERLMREYQHQVSNFEMDSSLRNVMNHKLAIKEYSRSSADQEVPLAHELRSEPILKMTMTYLLHKIMDLCEDEQINKGDWYHFVWDRTRSIRKDITQQELCSLNSVELVEQCARFHIHCASRLIAEHSADFDKKINTENLTKCLQTLKYMYNDLRIKNINCPNEAEFRAYIILLNLSDGNFLWEMNQLPEDIVKSQEVKMAMSFYFAMESNNYVKFFKLVKETSYLSACILIRYFTQIRVRALATFIRAYTRSFLPKDSVAVPLTYLTELLGFDSIDDAVNMFTYYGLNCDQEKVHLNRHTFLIPEFSYTMERSLLIESKRIDSVGKTICGKDLEPLTLFENHEIHDSFDENGYLKTEALNAEDQLRGEDLKNRRLLQKQFTAISDGVFKIPFTTPPAVPKHQPLKSLLGVAKQETHKSNDTVDNTTNLFNFKSNSETNQIFGNLASNLFKSATKPREESIFSKPEIMNPNEKPFSGNIFVESNSPSVTTSNIFAISKPSPANSKRESVFNRLDRQTFPVTTESGNMNSTQISEFKFTKVNQSNDKNDTQKNLNKIPKTEEQDFQINNEYLDKLKMEEENNRKQLQIEKEKLQSLEEQKIAEKKMIKKINEDSLKMFNEILRNVINVEILNISSEILEASIKLEINAKKICNDILDEFINEEINTCCNKQLAIKCRNQELLEKYFKIWFDRTVQSLQQRLLIESIPSWTVPDSLDERASKVAHPRQNETLNLMRRYRLGVSGHYPILNKTQEATKIDIIDILSKQFEMKPENLIRPGYLNHRKYFKLVISVPDENDEIPGFNSFINKWFENNIMGNNVDDNKYNSFICQSNEKLALAVRKVSGIRAKNEIGDYCNTECNNADAIIFIMTCGNYQLSYRRLKKILNFPIYKQIPIAVIVYNTTAHESVIEKELDLIKLQSKEIISHYSIFVSTELIEDLSLKCLFKKSLKFIACKEETKCELEMQMLTSFLTSTIGNEMFQRFFESCRLNPLFQKICNVPFYVVELYNELIDRILKFLDQDLNDYPEFPEDLRQFVPKRFSDIPAQIEHFDSDWKNIDRQKRIKDFLKKLKLPEISFETPTEIDQLEQWIYKYASTCIANNEKVGNKLGLAAIKTLLEKLYDPALTELPISSKLEIISWMDVFQTITLGILNHYWITDYKSLPINIYYNREKYEDLISNPWWLNTTQMQSFRMLTNMQGELETMKENQYPQNMMDLDELIARGNAAILKAEKKIKKLRIRTGPKADLDKSLNESLYKIELDKKMSRVDKVANNNKEIDLDQTIYSPKTKKFKSNKGNLLDDTDEGELNFEAILSNAESVINRFENRRNKN